MVSEKFNGTLVILHYYFHGHFFVTFYVPSKKVASAGSPPSWQAFPI
jgi:hypothetical protein